MKAHLPPEIDDRIHVAIKSYRRAGAVETFGVAPFAWVWVPESQGEEYRRFYGDRVITIPDEADGNLCRKSNAILDRSPCPWTLILDDDIDRISYFEGGERLDLEPVHFAQMIVHHFQLAADMGVTLWGINQNSDPMGHDTYQPFNLLAPVLGPFNGHLEPVVRYDERMLGKDDYDFWLRTIIRHRRTLRANKYHYFHDHGTKPGGFVSMRTREVELEGVRRMEERYGSRVFRAGGSAGGKSASGKNYLNSFVRVPIPGC